MATDISFALDNFARDAQRKRTQQEIKFKNTILQTQQETSLDALLVVDENGQIISYNQQFIDLWRLSPQLVSARDWMCLCCNQLPIKSKTQIPLLRRSNI